MLTYSWDDLIVKNTTLLNLGLAQSKIKHLQVYRLILVPMLEERNDRTFVCSIVFNVCLIHVFLFSIKPSGSMFLLKFRWLPTANSMYIPLSVSSSPQADTENTGFWKTKIRCSQNVAPHLFLHCLWYNTEYPVYSSGNELQSTPGLVVQQRTPSLSGRG